MRRVLVVDDQADALATLERDLRGYGDEWEPTYVEGGEAGLLALVSGRFDALITDLRMPGVDGPVLLRWAQEHRPKLVRIVLALSRHIEREKDISLLAHQVLAKPASPRDVMETVRRACDLRDLLQNDALAKIVAEVKTLPPHPYLYFEISRTMEDPSAGAAEVARIIQRDAALAAKTLQLVNSGFFSFQRRIFSLPHAVALLGMQNIRALVLSAEMHKSFAGRVPSIQIMDRLQARSLFVATLTRRMFRGSDTAEQAFTAGLVHEIGQLLLWTELPDRQEKVEARAARDDVPLIVAEKGEYGVTHAQVGAYLLGLWGLPYGIVEAVAFHHSPWEAAHDTFNTMAGLYVADCFATEMLDDGEVLVAPDPGYLDVVGVTDKLERWRQLAMEIAPVESRRAS